MFIRVHKNTFTRKYMLNICKTLQLKNFTRLKKIDLIVLLNKYYSGKYINKILYKKLKNIEFINYTDPITLCDIPTQCLCIEIQEGKVVRYDAKEFYNYLLNTGNFTDPFTCLPFSDNHIKQLDEQLSFYKINKISLFNIKYNSVYKNHFNEIRERNDQLLGVDRQLGEIITEIQDISEKIVYESIYGNLDNKIAEFYNNLINNLLPSFSNIFRQLSLLDKEYAKNCGNTYIETIKYGLPSINNIIKKFIQEEINFI